MATYKELVQQREALDAAITAAREAEVSSAIAQVREIVANYGLTQQDLFPSGRAASREASGSRPKVAIKYRDPQTGATWTGRGKAPRWIADKDRDQYLVP